MVGPQFRALHIGSKLGWRLVHEDRFVFYSEGTPRHGNVPYFKLSVGNLPRLKLHAGGHLVDPHDRAVHIRIDPELRGMIPLSSREQLDNVRYALRCLGGHVFDYSALSGKDIDLEEIEADYITSFHVNVLNPIAEDGLITAGTYAQLRALRKLMEEADGDRAMPWTEEGFRTHGYWRAVHLLAAEAWHETAEIPRKLPLAA